MKRVLFLLLAVFVTGAFALRDRSSADGKYTDLRQVLECSKDRASYGEFNDYGYWGGGPWCGQQGKSGYWVYLYPSWYVWGKKADSDKPQEPVTDDMPPPVDTADNAPPSNDNADNSQPPVISEDTGDDTPPSGNSGTLERSGDLPPPALGNDLRRNNPPRTRPIPEEASGYGKYRNLRQKLHCKRDRGTYGSYYDYGYWRGGRWCGQQGKGGYWVYVYPNWYVWGSRR